MTFHIHTTIKAARKHWDIFDLPKTDVFRILNGMEAAGKTLVKAEGCDNFDEETGCRGHKDEVDSKIIGGR